MTMTRAGMAACVMALAGCAANQPSPLAGPAGQLFCSIQTTGGGAIVAGLVDATVSAAAPGAGPLVIVATNATKAFVDAACAAAGGVPVAPPPNPATAPQIAVVPPKPSA